MDQCFFSFNEKKKQRIPYVSYPQYAVIKEVVHWLKPIDWLVCDKLQTTALIVTFAARAL